MSSDITAQNGRKVFRAFRTVYSYPFPEVRRLIDELAREFPHDVYLRALEEGGLDDFHEPVIEHILHFYSDYVPALGSFQFRYPTSGSEEGIREAMTALQGRGIDKIYMLKGEYEGYRETGKTRNITAIELDEDVNPRKLEPGYWFLSNPSARDGNIIPDDYVAGICDAGHRVFYDLAYLGSTRPHSFDLSHENIFAAVVSFSKPYGRFYDRIGFTFSREQLPALYANKWFKNIFGLMIADAIVTRMQPGDLYSTYRPVQESIVSRINDDFDLGLRASDALLLAHIENGGALMLDEKRLGMIEKFRRGSGYRFCLTPYYREMERRDPDEV